MGESGFFRGAYLPACFVRDHHGRNDQKGKWNRVEMRMNATSDEKTAPAAERDLCELSSQLAQWASAQASLPCPYNTEPVPGFHGQCGLECFQYSA